MKTKHTLPNNYTTGPDGSVVSFVPWRGFSIRTLKPVLHQGYLSVRVVTETGKRVRRMVHQVVCHQWHGPRPSAQHEVCHINGDKLDNRPENLRWGTRKDNAADRERHGRTSRGAKHSMAIKQGLEASHG